MAPLSQGGRQEAKAGVARTLPIAAAVAARALRAVNVAPARREAGKVYVSKFQEMPEISTPAAPGANKLRLFARDNGSGKTQLCVLFPTGAVQVIKTEP